MARATPCSCPCMGSVFSAKRWSGRQTDSQHLSRPKCCNGRRGQSGSTDRRRPECERERSYFGARARCSLATHAVTEWNQQRPEQLPSRGRPRICLPLITFQNWSPKWLRGPGRQHGCIDHPHIQTSVGGTACGLRCKRRHQCHHPQKPQQILTHSQSLFYIYSSLSVNVIGPIRNSN